MDDRIRISRLPRPPLFQDLDGASYYGLGTTLKKGKDGIFVGLRLWILWGQVWPCAESPNEAMLLAWEGFFWPESQPNEPQPERAALRQVWRFAGGASFGPKRRRIGLVLGIMIYAVGRTSGGCPPEAGSVTAKEHVLAQLASMVAELRKHGFRDTDLRGALQELSHRVSVIVPVVFWAWEKELFRTACALRHFARRQAPWLPIGFPG